LITGFETSIIDGIIFPPGNGTITTTVITPTIVSPSSTATFSLYQNGIVLANAIRIKINSNYTNEISLQAIATVMENQPIEVRWNVSTGTLKLSNRILTLINVR
jgi:siroheme synthase (precorrin-2 oxidase/ferrochelatase)